MDAKKKIEVAKFEQVAAANGYEVFTAQQIGEYCKEGLMKSRSGNMTAEERENFTTDMMYLQKAICVDENGKEVTRYYRKQQVKWEETPDGTILKGIEGVYLNTPENKRLNRVGKPYVASPEFLKSILVGENADSDIIKAIQTGVYSDTPENQALGRVGKPFMKSYEDKSEVEKRERKLEERIGGIKGDKKLHDEAIERKDKEASKKEAKRSEKTDSDYESVNQKNRESKAQRDKNIEERLKTGWMEVGDGRVAKVVENLRDGSFIARFYDGKEEFDDKVSPGTRMYEALSSSEKFPKDTLRKYRDYLQGVLSTTKSKVLYEYYKKEIAKTSEKIGEKSEEEKAREADVKKKTDKKESVKKEDTDSKPSEEKESEQVYTRVKFEDIPNSGKVNLKNTCPVK